MLFGSCYCLLKTILRFNTKCYNWTKYSTSTNKSKLLSSTRTSLAEIIVSIFNPNNAIHDIQITRAFWPQCPPNLRIIYVQWLEGIPTGKSTRSASVFHNWSSTYESKLNLRFNRVGPVARNLHRLTSTCLTRLLAFVWLSRDENILRRQLGCLLFEKRATFQTQILQLRKFFWFNQFCKICSQK